MPHACTLPACLKCCSYILLSLLRPAEDSIRLHSRDSCKQFAESCDCLVARRGHRACLTSCPQLPLPPRRLGLRLVRCTTSRSFLSFFDACFSIHRMAWAMRQRYQMECTRQRCQREC